MPYVYGRLFLLLVLVTVAYMAITAYTGGLSEVFPPCPTEISC